MKILLSTLLGLTFGSFANVCLYRLPQDKSVIKPRSFCPHCRKTIQAWQNVPLLSFIVLGKRCASCHAPISWRYFIVEALMGIIFALHAYLLPISIIHLCILNVFVFYLLTISIIDFEHLIIPDELSLSLIVLGWSVSFINPYFSGTMLHKFIHSLLATLVGGGLMLGIAWAGEKIFKKEALGGGDIKLIAAIASLLGWKGVYGPLVIGSLAGGMTGLVLLLIKRKKLGETLPFGPFLSIGAYVTAIFPGLWQMLLNEHLNPFISLDNF